MGIRTILVPLGANFQDAVALRLALSVARRMNAHVEALFIEIPNEAYLGRVGRSEDGVLNADMIDALRAEAGRQRQTVRQDYEEAITATGVPERAGPGMQGASVSWHTARGEWTRVVAEEAAVHDLVVVSGAGNGGLGAGEIGGALLDSARPMLLANGVAEMMGPSAGVVIGWNPTPQAGRAMTQAMPFIRDARGIHLVHVRTGARTGPDVERAARYLAWHGIEVEARTLETQGRSVGEVLLDQVRDTGSDMLVMGAYSHSRLRELLLGGVTRYVVAHAGVPVLMVH